MKCGVREPQHRDQDEDVYPVQADGLSRFAL
jgi:hypothetical protein